VGGSLSGQGGSIVAGLDPVSNLLSGLLGAVIGAIAGGAITLWSQDREMKERRIRAGRTVHMEMTSNSAFLETIAGGNDPGPLTTYAWEAYATELAGLLSPLQFRDVGWAYAYVRRLEQRRLDWADGEGLTPKEQELMREHSRDFQAAADELRHIVWPGYGS
jgi:hypothetical protein